MPRARKNKEDAWLPPRVYRGKSAYEYRPKDARYVSLYPLVRDDNGTLIETPEVRRSVLEAYDKAATAQKKDVDYWLSKWLASERFRELSPLTQSDYTRYIEIKATKEPDSRNGIRHVFGKMHPKAIKPHHIRKYMDYWAKAGKRTTANRHLSCLQSFLGWCREQNAGVTLNPAKEITKYREQARKYYVADAEYEKLLKAAEKSSTRYVAAFIEITYLCGLRKFEALQLNVEDIHPEGLLIRRGKGSEGEYTEISPRLQNAIDLAISLHKQPEPIKDRPLIRNTRNQRVTRSAIQQAWSDIRKDAGLPHIKIHDLKKKAITDGKDAGHRSQRMKDLYKVKPDVKKATR